jgi:very-short-patch-repair endonuclease
MARTARIPHELTTRPFSLAEARQAGLTHSALRGSAWRRLGSELYCWEGVKEDAWLRLAAWRRLLPREAVFTGTTAAWLMGLDLDPIHPVEAVVPPLSNTRSRPGLTVRRCQVAPSEIVTIRKLRTTNLLWTLADVCLRYPAIEALIAIDMALRARLTNSVALGQYAGTARGRPGAGRLRFLSGLAAPAESPMETRLRWLLIQARLPQPEVQTNLLDADGRFVARADIYYPAARLVLEYDGRNHRDRLVDDDRRQNLLVNAGFRLLRFTAADIHNRPEVVESQVRGALMRTVGFMRA